MLEPRGRVREARGRTHRGSGEPKAGDYLGFAMGAVDDGALRSPGSPVPGVELEPESLRVGTTPLTCGYSRRRGPFAPVRGSENTPPPSQPTNYCNATPGSPRPGTVDATAETTRPRRAPGIPAPIPSLRGGGHGRTEAAPTTSVVHRDRLARAPTDRPGERGSQGALASAPGQVAPCGSPREAGAAVSRGV